MIKQNKKALIVATVGSFIEFEKNDIRILKELGYDVTVACNTWLGEKYLKGIDAKFVNIPFARSPISKSNLQAFRQLKELMLQQEFALIHCHTPVAGVLTRFAARALRGKGCRIIYTAHGFHFFKGAPFVNWLVFYTAEWICSWLTDVLITINKEDYFLAKKRFHAKEIQYVPGVGVNTDKINLCNPNKKIIRRNLGLSDDEKMIVSVGELNSNKNHEAVIRALGKIADTRIHYFIAGNGELGEYLKEIANEVGINNNFHLLGYRTDVIELNMTADLYCHPSYREGLSVALMEAIAAGTRVACSDIRGNRDLAEDCANVVLFDPHNIDNIASVIVSSMNRDVASNDGIEKYSLNVVQERMRTIYCSEK